MFPLKPFGKFPLEGECSQKVDREMRSYFSLNKKRKFGSTPEGSNDWGGWGYDDFVPEEVTKTAPSGDRTT